MKSVIISLGMLEAARVHNDHEAVAAWCLAVSTAMQNYLTGVLQDQVTVIQQEAESVVADLAQEVI